jgi:hypothetical protein
MIFVDTGAWFAAFVPNDPDSRAYVNATGRNCCGPQAADCERIERPLGG